MDRRHPATARDGRARRAAGAGQRGLNYVIDEYLPKNSPIRRGSCRSRVWRGREIRSLEPPPRQFPVYAPYTIEAPPASTMRACTFRMNGDDFPDPGQRHQAERGRESASASVAIGAMTLTVRYSEGLRPVAGSNRWTSSAQPPRTCSPTILRAFWPKRSTAITIETLSSPSCETPIRQRCGGNPDTAQRGAILPGPRHRPLSGKLASQRDRGPGRQSAG